MRKILDALEEGSRKVLEAATPAPHCSSMVVRVAPFPFFNFKLLSSCGGTPNRWTKNWQFSGSMAENVTPEPPEPPGTPWKSVPEPPVILWAPCAPPVP